MNHKIILFQCIVIILLFMAGCAVTRLQSPINKGQSAQKFSVEVTRVIDQEYLLHLPETYETSEQSWPLMLFLHGAGERGDSLDLVTKHGPPQIVQHQSDFPFILISPQCPKKDWWTNSYQIEFLSKLLDDVVQKYRVDQDRIYVTGLSMGGYGTWKLATLYPQRFAAIAPICGGGETKEACKLKNLPIWVFHGAQDEVVKVQESEKMVEAIKACGGNVKFTVYPEAKHDSWTESYENQELYRWFLQHVRKK